MSRSAPDSRARLLEWLQAAVDEGWIPEKEISKLESLESQGAEILFDSGRERPLTVAFFGGTGVGKSSLLNRLAGEAVAEVGLERPTSTAVTLYVHEEYPVRRLDDSFPVERVRILRHRRDECRDVAWIDMPDIDSIERGNRELVFEWLPYIDWLVYVVSPERYRDDAGWRVLKERGYRHHWMFVMNRLDTGAGEELEDFKRLLGSEGLDDSLVLGTSCAEPGDDDFQRISQIIDEAVTEHGREGLQQVGERARLSDLERECRRYAGLLGDPDLWRKFIAQGESLIDRKLAALERYLADQAALEARRVSDRRSGDAVPASPARPGLIADYVQDLRSGVTVSAEQLPARPILARTRAMLEPLAERVAAAFREGFAEGASRPGNGLQRFVVASMRRLVYGLPLVAGIGIAYVVAVRYQQGLSGGGGFLGLDFLVHSLMVLGLSALLPYLLARLLRPSVQRWVVRRVRARLDGLRSEVTGEWAAAMEKLRDRSGELRRSLELIQADISSRRGGGGGG